MPIEAAARSFERTASILRPLPARMMLPTRTKAIVTTTSVRTPNDNRAMLRPSRTERLRPNSSGSGMRFGAPGHHRGLSKMNRSMATAAARVTIASWAPRMRSAGSPTTIPPSPAIAAASSSDSGNGTPVPNFASTSPATPANEVWTSEICPTVPVSSTNERAISDTARLVMTPKR